MQGQITQESLLTTVPMPQAFNSTATIATFIRFISKKQRSTWRHTPINHYIYYYDNSGLSVRPAIQAFIRFSRLRQSFIRFDIKNSEKINKAHSNYSLRHPNSQRLTCHADMAFGRGGQCHSFSPDPLQRTLGPMRASLLLATMTTSSHAHTIRTSQLLFRLQQELSRYNTISLPDIYVRD